MQLPSERPPLMHHVFVDFENVRDIDLAVFGRERVSITFLVGANEKKLDVALVEKLFTHASSVQFVRLTSSAKNALDFALAYHLGRAAATEPTAHFYIVSKDTGFDPLVTYLKSRGVSVNRHGQFESLPFLNKTPKTTPVVVGSAVKKAATPPKPTKAATDPVSRILKHLGAKASIKRPKKKTTLIHDLQSLLKPMTEDKVIKCVEKLEKDRHIEIDENAAVKYLF